MSDFLSTRRLLPVVLCAVAIASGVREGRGQSVPATGEVRLEQIRVTSAAMGSPRQALVLLPPGYDTVPLRRFPVLYLLHGAGGDHQTWVRNTALARDLASRELIIVCPDGMRWGWYVDSPVRQEAAVETHLIRELIPYMDRTFRTIRGREGRAIAGFSMGGHGALTLAAKHPGLFVAASSLSGVFDPLRWDGNWYLRGAFGDPVANRAFWITNSALGLAGRFTDTARDVAVMIDCGVLDFALAENRELHQKLKESGMKTVYRERPGGHDFAYWSAHIGEHLDFHLAAMTRCEAADAAPVPGPGAGTGFFFHPAFLAHDTGPGHPEHPDRLRSIVQGLHDQGLWNRLTHITPSPATLATLARVHDPAYIARVQDEINAGARQLSTGDTMLSPGSWTAALLAAGAVCDAVDAVVSGRLRNAFCAVRPPGHHARPDGGMGFCIFNNIAVAARHARHVHGLDRILIVDWDVHHGNGTQAAFLADSAVLQFHTHQRGLFPGTGAEDEHGEGEAQGRVMNFPLPPGSGIAAFEALYTGTLLPAARRFRPQLVLVSAGYDAHADDPLGGFLLGTEDFGRLTAILLALAEELCEGRVVFVLEGGYDHAALAAAAAATLSRMLAVTVRAPIPP